MTGDNRSARNATHATRRWSGGLAEMLGFEQERQHALTGPEPACNLGKYSIMSSCSGMLAHPLPSATLETRKVWRLLSAAAM
jgi:hypothetical protein